MKDETGADRMNVLGERSKPLGDVNNEIDLSQVWRAISAGKWWIMLVTIAFSVCSVFYSLSLPNIYKSEALLMSNTQQDGRSSIGGISGQLGGLASLAGINIGNNTVDKTEYALAIMKSRKFIYQFIDQNELKADLTAAIGWDKAENKLLYDKDLFNALIGDHKGAVIKTPSIHDTYLTFLANNVMINRDEDSGLINITAYHYSPFVAQKIVNLLVKDINNTVKLQDIQEANKSIKYLKNELLNTDNTEMQSTFYKLIEQQQQKLMLAKVRNDYVFKVLDEPIVPERKDKPKRALIVVFCTLLGAFFSLALVLVLSFRRGSKV